PGSHLKCSKKEYIQKTDYIYGFLESEKVQGVVEKMPKYNDSYVFLMKHRYSVFLKSMRFILKGLNIA
ncbi:MAG: hypothetical protein SO412_03545, partial [Erysipelotrichaceae bacterium]|nr:hypothetical protein [Erysipelotrichaceae bacterium]